MPGGRNSTILAYTPGPTLRSCKKYRDRLGSEPLNSPLLDHFMENSATEDPRDS